MLPLVTELIAFKKLLSSADRISAVMVTTVLVLIPSCVTAETHLQSELFVFCLDVLSATKGLDNINQNCKPSVSENL